MSEDLRADLLFEWFEKSNITPQEAVTIMITVCGCILARDAVDSQELNGEIRDNQWLLNHSAYQAFSKKLSNKKRSRY